MSLTSYRAAPPRVWYWMCKSGCWKTWRRPTLPRLKTQYHGRWGFSRPSSGWDRVRAPRQSHQVVQPRRSCRCGMVSWVTKVLVCDVRDRVVCMLCIECVLRSVDLMTSSYRRCVMWMTAVRDGRAYLTGAPKFIEPIGLLGPVSSERYRPYTSGLSTWWSSTALRETWF